MYTSSDGSATTTAPPSWTNSSLAGIFEKKYTKTIDTYWPYGSTSSPSKKEGGGGGGGGFPGWAGAVIGVVLGLLIIAFLVGFWFYRRRRHRRQREKAANEKAENSSNPPEWMYAGGPTSPGPGPVSSSTGVETTETSRTHDSMMPSIAQSATTQPSTLQDSIISPLTPGTVESGGDEVYEMHGMNQPKQYYVSLKAKLAYAQIPRLLNYRPLSMSHTLHPI
jgi:hypothetical protein